jgi:hypothetical protein
MEDDLKILKPKSKRLEMKTTSNGRRPPNFKSWIPQHPLIGSSQNFRGINQNQKCLKWRGPQMEDDIKISKVEYLRNHWSDLPQILNLISGDQTWKMLEMKTTSNGRRPGNMKRWISQQPLIESSSNLNFKLRGPHQNQNCSKWRRPPIEDELKILKVEYLSNY